jgi:hypothetical protein
MDSENTHMCAQNAENGFGFVFLERYHKYGDEFLNRSVTGDENWISFVNVKANEQSTQWMHAQSSNKPKMFKQTHARKMMATVSWERNGALMVELMQQRATITSEVYCETLKNCVERKAWNADIRCSAPP